MVYLQTKDKIMVQYLTIGIATMISVEKDRARRQASATPERIKEALEEHYNSRGIYTVEENEYSVYLSLRPEVAEAELVAMLEDFYKMRYPGKNAYVEKVMQAIRSATKWDEWLTIAEEKRYEYFQYDEYVVRSTPCEGGWMDSVSTNIKQIILSIDGKILMECYGSLFNFFTSLIRGKLSKYALAESLQVNISG